MTALTRSAGSTLRLVSQACVGSSSRSAVGQRSYATKKSDHRPKGPQEDYSASSLEGLDASLLHDVLPNTAEKSYVVKWKGKGFPFLNVCSLHARLPGSQLIAPVYAA